MKLAIYQSKVYECRELANKRVILLSNGWQEGFSKYQEEQCFYYAKKLKLEDIENMQERNLYLKTGKETGPEIRLYETIRGTMVGFLEENLEKIPEKIKEILQQDECFRYAVPFDTLKKELKRVEIRYRHEDIFDSSFEDHRVDLKMAMDISARLFTISADRECVPCRACTMRAPFENAKVEIGKTYNTKCPYCGIQNVQRRN